LAKKKGTKSKKKTKSKSKSKGNKKPFGGYAINFAERTETLQEVFGSSPIPPSEMTKKLWVFIKSNNLGNK